MMMIQFKVDIKIKNDQMKYQSLKDFQNTFAVGRLLFVYLLVTVMAFGYEFDLSLFCEESLL